MSVEARPFTAATNKLAYAQAFTRTSPRTHDGSPVVRRHARPAWLTGTRRGAPTLGRRSSSAAR